MISPLWWKTFVFILMYIIFSLIDCSTQFHSYRQARSNNGGDPSMPSNSTQQMSSPSEMVQTGQPIFDLENCRVNLWSDVGKENFINLIPLSSKGKPRYKTTASDGHHLWTYTYDPCFKYDMPLDNSHAKGIQGDRCHSVLMCKYFYDSNNDGYFFPLAVPLLENVEVEVSMKQGTPVYWLIYTGIDSVRHTKSKIALICAPEIKGEAKFKVISDNGSTTVFAELRHKCCCPGHCLESDSAKPDGTLLVFIGTVVSLVMVVALIGGLCYVKRTHIQIYSKLPGVHHTGNTKGAILSDLRDYEPANLTNARHKLLPVLADVLVESHTVELGQRLGGGIFADTHLAKWKEMTVTVKRLTLSIHSKQLTTETIDWMKEEVAALSHQRHKNIVCVLGLCVDGRLPFLLTEYVIGECLKDYLKVNGHLLTWPQRMRMCSQVADGMAFLHSNRPPTLHRDLRCGNLFLSDNDMIKVADFGMIKLLQPLRDQCEADDCSCQRQLSGCPATIRWTAPEVLSHPRSKEGESSIISTASDVYSFGLLMWEMVMCKDPFHKLASETEVIEIVKNGGRPDVPSSAMMPQFRDLMKSCWDQRPSHRPAFKQIAARLKELIGLARTFQKSLLNAKHRVHKPSETSRPV